MTNPIELPARPRGQKMGSGRINGKYLELLMHSDEAMDAYGRACAEAAVAAQAAEMEALRAASRIEIDRHSLSPADILKRVIRNLKPKRGRPMWSAVHEATAHGSTVSIGLCQWAGVDPDTGAALKEQTPNPKVSGDGPQGAASA